MRRLAVLTSGGDAPGMNAAIAAVVKSSLANNIEVFGISRGYSGLLKEEISELKMGAVEDIIHRGGTILRSTRSESFQTPEGQKQAVSILKEHAIEGLIVIGGNGSFRGAMKLSKLGYPVVGIPATIDNDIAGTEYTIGFDSAVNTVIEAIDKVKETTSSVERSMVFEVMGRDAGDIALWTGISTGAEAIIIPEEKYDIDKIVQGIEESKARGKNHFSFVVAEGVCSGEEFKKQLEEKVDLELRVLVLGYLQRGGFPTAYDRMTATKMGARAVTNLLNGSDGQMMCVRNGKIIEIPFSKAETELFTLDISKDYQLATSVLG